MSSVQIAQFGYFAQMAVLPVVANAPDDRDATPKREAARTFEGVIAIMCLRKGTCTSPPAELNLAANC